MDSRTTTTENREEGQMVGLKTLEERTSRSLDELEALAPGDAGWRAGNALATAELDLLTGAAEGKVFDSRVLPHGADVQADADAYLAAREIRNAEAPEGYAKLHSDSLDTYPALAEWLRSSLGLDRVRQAAGIAAAGMGRDAKAAVAEAVDRFRRLVAAQMVKRPDLEIDTVAAETFATTVPALRERLAAARKLHVDAVSEAEAAARAKVRAKHAALSSRVRSLPENAPVPSYLAQQDRATSTTRRARDLADDLERGKLELTDEAFADLERSVAHQETRWSAEAVKTA